MSKPVSVSRQRIITVLCVLGLYASGPQADSGDWLKASAAFRRNLTNHQRQFSNSSRSTQGKQNVQRWVQNNAQVLQNFRQSTRFTNNWSQASGRKSVQKSTVLKPAPTTVMTPGTGSRRGVHGHYTISGRRHWQMPAAASAATGMKQLASQSSSAKGKKSLKKAKSSEAMSKKELGQPAETTVMSLASGTNQQAHSKRVRQVVQGLFGADSSSAAGHKSLKKAKSSEAMRKKELGQPAETTVMSLASGTNQQAHSKRVRQVVQGLFGADSSSASGHKSLKKAKSSEAMSKKKLGEPAETTVMPLNEPAETMVMPLNEPAETMVMSPSDSIMPLPVADSEQTPVVMNPDQKETQGDKSNSKKEDKKRRSK